MKNPWMSMWLSAANSSMSASRGLWAAEAQRAQSAMVAEMTRQTMAFWLPNASTQSALTSKPKTRRKRSTAKR